MVDNGSTCPETESSVSFSGSSHEKPNPIGSIEIRHSQTGSVKIRRDLNKIQPNLDKIRPILDEIRLDFDKIRLYFVEIQPFLTCQCCFIGFDRNRHCTADSKPNQTVFFGGWWRIRFLVTQSDRVGFELDTNLTRIDPWTSLAVLYG
nr:hypothetical protein CFP56_72905 [Quercus suber]